MFKHLFFSSGLRQDGAQPGSAVERSDWLFVGTG